MNHTPGFHLYLIRHGESANNALPDAERVADPALTELGERQAQHLADHYRNVDRIDQVLSSPFKRTMQTAQPLLTARGTGATIWTDLYEVGGCFSGHERDKLKGEAGMTADEINRDFPDFAVPDDIDHRGWYKGRPFETWETAIPRAQQQADKLIAEFAHTDSVVFCFIHADFKQLLLQHLVPDQPDYHGSGIPNTSVTHIHFSGSSADLQKYRDTAHLEPSAISF